jgi:hypothetical protein
MNVGQMFSFVLGVEEDDEAETTIEDKNLVDFSAVFSNRVRMVIKFVAFFNHQDLNKI